METQLLLTWNTTEFRVVWSKPLILLCWISSSLKMQILMWPEQANSGPHECEDLYFFDSEPFNDNEDESFKDGEVMEVPKCYLCTRRSHVFSAVSVFAMHQTKPSSLCNCMSNAFLKRPQWWQKQLWFNSFPKYFIGPWGKIRQNYLCWTCSRTSSNMSSKSWW